MAYLGNAPVVGDSTNSFKLLDDIASFTLTFDATDTSVVSISGDTLSFTNHRFVTGQKVTYTDGGGTAIGGLTDETSYFIIKVDQNTIKLATNASNAASSTAINLTSGAAGGSHTLKVAFDGVNTKFKATHSSGTKANISRAGQISLSINGVIQHPSTGAVTRAYTMVSGLSNKLQFTTAPELGVEIQIRHLGFAAASTSSGVTHFYGRTGNVGLTTADNITVGDITATSADFSGNVSVGGVLTYEDVTNVDSVGVGTFRDGIKVGSGVTIEPNGNASFGGVGVVTFSSSGTTIYGQAGSIRVGTAMTIGHTEGLVYHTQNLHSAGFEVNQVNASGIITASQFKGDGSELTGVSGFSTALSNDTTSLLNNVFKTSVQHNVAAGTSVTIQSDAGCGNIAFTRLDRINVGTGATLHIGAGTTFLMNVLKVFS